MPDLKDLFMEARDFEKSCWRKKEVFATTLPRMEMVFRVTSLLSKLAKNGTNQLYYNRSTSFKSDDGLGPKKGPNPGIGSLFNKSLTPSRSSKAPGFSGVGSTHLSIPGLRRIAFPSRKGRRYPVSTHRTHLAVVSIPGHPCRR